MRFVLNRAQKEAFVADLNQGVQQSQAVALLSFSKLTVEQFTSFRLSLRKQDVRVKVVKNTLAKRVFEASPYKDLASHLEGPTLIAYGTGDPVTTAKAIWEWTKKENFNVEVKGGVALGQIMSKAQLEALSKLPGRKDLLVSFLWALKSSPTKFLYALQDAPKRLGYALAALQKKKETQPT
jgi:large subunit ribosomal protein L10